MKQYTHKCTTQHAHFLFGTMSVLALGPTKPPIHWALGGLISQNMKLHLVPRLKMCGPLCPSPTFLHDMVLKQRSSCTFLFTWLSAWVL